MICIPAIVEQQSSNNKLFDQYFEYEYVEFGYKRLFFEGVITRQNIFNIPKGAVFSRVVIDLNKSTITFHPTTFSKNSITFNLSISLSK